MLSSRFDTVTAAREFSASLGPCSFHLIRSLADGAQVAWKPLRLKSGWVPSQHADAPAFCARITPDQTYMVLRETDDFYIIRDDVNQIRKVSRDTMRVARMRYDLSPVFEVA